MRFSFRECDSGKWSSAERIPTQPARTTRKAKMRTSGGSGSAGRLVERRPLDLARLVRLEDVVFLDVVEAVEQDAALEALGHLARVLLEPLQLGDRGVVDDRAVADDAHLRAPADDAAA